MPVSASVLTQSLAGLASGAEMRIHQRVQFGQLAELTCWTPASTKTHRCAPRVAPWAPASSTRRSARLGKTWAAVCLASARSSGWRRNWPRPAAGRRVGRCCGQQSLFGPRDFKPGAGQSLWNDGWDGYSAARARLTAALQRRRVPNPVLLGGDVHENWVGDVKADYADPASASIGVEFCGTSITSRSGGNARTAERLAENPTLCLPMRSAKGMACWTTPRLNCAPPCAW